MGGRSGHDTDSLPTRDVCMHLAEVGGRCSVVGPAEAAEGGCRVQVLCWCSMHVHTEQGATRSMFRPYSS
jgi:hypothetical protein